jgi:hypothetical protein
VKARSLYAGIIHDQVLPYDLRTSLASDIFSAAVKLKVEDVVTLANVHRLKLSNFFPNKTTLLSEESKFHGGLCGPHTDSRLVDG